MDGFKNDKIPLKSHGNDAVHWFLNELKYRIVAASGKPSDSCHLGKLILQSLKDDPQSILQIDGSTGTSETFGSILQRTVQCANGLRKLGVNTGDVMILMAPNHLDLAIPFYAALYLGITIAPIDIHLKINELEDTFRIDNPKIIFCQNNRLPDVMEAANRTGLKSAFVTFDKGDNALSFADLLLNYGNDVTVDDFRCSDFDPISTISILLSTSGTTGKPKSAAVSHRSFGTSISYLWTRYTKFPTPTKMAFVVSPLQWLSAIMMFLMSPIMRVTRLQSTLPMTQEHAYELINKYRPTYMIVSPTMMTTLIKPGDREKCDFTCFETFIIGGSAVDKSLIAEVKKITPNASVLETYGLSEATALVFQDSYPLPGSCGKPIGLFQYRLIDPSTGAEITEPHVPGELRIYGPALFSGYFNNPEETKAVFEDGWLKTGDIFYRDENWNFFFLDRLKLLLDYKNHIISPVEIEGVIRQHPSVLDVAVVGLPDPECGDLPVACVVPRPGHTIKADEIKNLVKENLTDPKQLRGGVIFMSELPATATMKLHRQKLKEIVLSAHREEQQKPLTNHANDAAHWFLNELKYRIVAESGKPSDSCHLGKIILQSLKDDPQFISQIDGSIGASEPFDSILQRSVQCANGLRELRVNTGDVMILMAPNHLDLAIPFYAALYLGIIIAPIDIFLKLNELEDVFRINNPKIIFCQNNRLPDVMEAANRTGLKPMFVTFDKGENALSFADFLMNYGNDVDVNDFRCSDFDPASTISILLSTSGTTGKPKSAAVPHRSFGISMPYFWTMHTKFPTPTKMVCIVSPLQWLSAVLHFLMSPIMRYTRLQSTLPMTQEHAYELINNYKPTSMIVSPTMMTSLIKSGDRKKCDFTCFETLIIGGSAVHEKLIAEVKKITPNTQVLGTYGLSEATTLVFQDSNPPPGSCGKPIGLFQYRLVDPTTGADITEYHVPGELIIFGPALFSGYFNNPEETKAVFEDGWLKTGDMFYRDENWNFFFVDRLKQLLKYKNHQISPVEVENVIRQHPGIMDVAVVGLPDPECGDLPVACVVPKPGHTIKADEIKNIVKENLTDMKQLRGGVIFMSELPATATTKLHRQKLKEIVLSAHRE